MWFISGSWITISDFWNGCSMLIILHRLSYIANDTTNCIFHLHDYHFHCHVVWFWPFCIQLCVYVYLYIYVVFKLFIFLDVVFCMFFNLNILFHWLFVVTGVINKILWFWFLFNKKELVQNRIDVVANIIQRTKFMHLLSMCVFVCSNGHTNSIYLTHSHFFSSLLCRRFFALCRSSNSIRFLVVRIQPLIDAKL